MGPDEENLAEKKFYHVEYQLKDKKLYNANYENINEDPIASSDFINAASKANVFSHNYSPTTGDENIVFSLWETDTKVRQEDLKTFIQTHIVYESMGDIKINQVDLLMGAFGLPASVY